MGKELQFNSQARKSLLNGVELVNNAVKVTMGARGRTVILDRPFGSPTVTKDGVSVAREVEAVDKFEQIGVQLLKEVAVKTNDDAGDGTTTATVLASAMSREGMKAVETGISQIGIKRGMDKAVMDVVEVLAEEAKPVETAEQIKSVATISANGDEYLGGLISEAMDNVGSDGIVTVEESRSVNTYVDYVEGMDLEVGYASPYFCRDRETMTVEFDDAFIFMTDQDLTTTNQIIGIIEQTLQAGKPLVIIADKVEGELLPNLIVNQQKGNINVCVVKAPSFKGKTRQDIFEDIATICEGGYFPAELGYNLNEIELKDLGYAKKVKIKENSTTIIIEEDESIQSAVEERIDLLNRSISETSSEYDIEKIRERIAKLTSGVAVLYVGGATEVELKEKKHRAEDAMSATRSAIEEGIVAGGGTALLTCATKLRERGIPDLMDAEKVGYEIVLKAIEEPMRQISENAGISGDVVIAKAKEQAEGVGFDVYNEVWVNMIEKGIIDPVKVTRSAIQNACSIASLLLTTECSIAISLDPDKVGQV